MTAISTDEFDKRFDDGEDLEEYLDTSHVVVHKAKSPRILLTPPAWLVGVLDEEAERRGIARKALINTILVDWADGIESRQRCASSRLWPRADEDLPRSPDDAA